ncbi:hypothetical protein [Stackebrandtia nassauensis]|uniref:HNH endonuclease n=1 Tax=Stackebrandtia nassauensis (strain DSM 44728 / CIP 108903 / NRRL B-16338 / NBRC 102104 / LLR-40K-21) TaxID=446470 RepID=D3Q3Y8_STANL|nr:hypothetical protein [Stackebrandtia nassauensis]ADD44055.1 hypothetical protein Snas_4409 [Stackebrandtia nassauensis DSM 44728]
MGDRDYRIGNDRGLFLFGKGYCYFPKCQVRALREVGDNLVTQVQRAHIYAAKAGGLRYDPMMTVEERKSHRNLILLCYPHHAEVDLNTNLHKYPASLLLQWKKDREGDQLEALRGLEGLSQEKFERMLIDSVASAKSEILGAISDLPEEIGDLLRNELDKAFRGPELDKDAIYSLNHATTLLARMEFPYQTDALWKAAKLFSQLVSDTGLGRLPDALQSSNFRRLPGIIDELERQADLPDSLDRSLSNLDKAQRTIERLENVTEQLADQSITDIVDRGRFWDYLKIGAVVGFVAGLLVAGAVAYLISLGAQ